MKIYDKEMYARSESVKSALVIMIAFMLGFLVGCLAVNKELTNKVTEKESYIVDLEKTIREHEEQSNTQNTAVE